MKKKFCYLIYSTLLVSCSLSTNNESATLDPFFNDVLNNMEGIEVDDSQIIEPQVSNVYMPMHMTIDQNQNIIVVDGSTWTIHLLTIDGKTISTFGKIGSGPREFQQINYANLTKDQQLIVGDLRSQRITILNVHADSFEYKDSFVFENTAVFENFTMSSPRLFTKVKNNYVGLILTPNPNREFKLVEFDLNLRPQKIIMSIPIHRTNGIFSNTSLTDMSFRLHEDNFIQVYFDSLMVQTFNLENYQTSRDTLLNAYSARNVSPFHADELAKLYNGMEVNTNLLLPILRSGYSNQTHTIFPLIYYGGDFTPVIVKNKVTNTTYFLKAPKGFYMYSYSNNIFAGIIVDPINGNKIVTMNMN